MKYHVSGLLVWFCILSTVRSQGQTIPSVPTIKTPETSAFDRVVEMPVSQYTGVPSVDIPLYEIDIKGVKVPISLNYHAGGIRVDQEATVVGLGWNLNFGGQISRSVKGKPDEWSFLKAGFDPNFSSYSINSYLSLPDVHEEQYLIQRNNNIYYSKSQNHIYDYRPDDFNYSAPGFSGRFMYKQSENRFVLFPKEDILPNFYLGTTNEGTVGTPILKWELKLPNGNKITYGDDAITRTGVWDHQKTTNSWLIKKIENVYTESIDFNYLQLQYNLWNISGDHFTYNEKQIVHGPTAPHNFQDAVIQSINFPNGNITFTLEDREDHPSKKISEMRVFNSEGYLVRDIKFYYGYFYGDFGDVKNVASIYTGNPDGYDHKRMRLDSVVVLGNDTDRMTYKFDYYSNATLPSKRSYAQDFWGFYNGAYNLTLVPKVLFDQTTGKYGNRKVNPSSAKAFSLKSVTYPTGGRSEFVFESNTAKPDGPDRITSIMQNPSMRPGGMSIYLYGGNRLEYGGLEPDYIGEFGEKYFRREFVVPEGAVFNQNTIMICNSNYYKNNATDNALECYGNNVVFLLEKEKPDGTYAQIHFYRIRDCGMPPNQMYLGSETFEMPTLQVGGKYRMSIVLWLNSSNYAPNIQNGGHVTNFNIGWLEPNANVPQYVLVGGLRVKDIKSYDQDGTLLSHREFNYNLLNSNETSGNLVSFPNVVQNWRNLSDTAPYTDIRVSGNAVYPLETTCGSYIGYTTVTEKIVSADQTLTVQYGFSFKTPMHDPWFNNIDYGIIEAHEWERGKLILKRYLKGQKVIRTEDYRYNDISPHLTSNTLEDYVEEINTDFISAASLGHGRDKTLPDFYDLVIGDPVSIPGMVPLPLHQITFRYNVDNFDIPDDIVSTLPPDATLPPTYSTSLPLFKKYTGFDKPSMTIITTTDDNDRAMIDTVNNFYDSTPVHYQLTRSETRNSKNQLVVTSTKYPSDFSEAPYPQMMQQHMLLPIESTNSTAGTTTSVTTNCIQYGSMFVPSTIVTKVDSNTAETRFIYSNYDSKGNSQTQNKANDGVTNFLFGHDKQYVIATAINTNLSDIAYTSFEEPDAVVNQGNWQITGTGRSSSPASRYGDYSFVLGTGIILQKTGLNSALTYIVSYWSRSGSYSLTGTTQITTGPVVDGWTYFEHQINGVTAITLSGAGQIDELKLYPSGAGMTTYTYRPLVGITSMTDQNNQSMYYEYDGQNRLMVIMDSFKNIRKTYKYHYQKSN